VFKGLQAGTLVKVTKIRATPDAPRSPMRWDQVNPGCSIAASGDSLPVDYEMEGVLLADVEVGQSVYLARMVRNGELVNGIFTSSRVASLAQDGFATADSVYRIEQTGGAPGEFAFLAELLLK
jgi:hypothetical protein